MSTGGRSVPNYIGLRILGTLLVLTAMASIFFTLYAPENQLGQILVWICISLFFVLAALMAIAVLWLIG